MLLYLDYTDQMIEHEFILKCKILVTMIRPLKS